MADLISELRRHDYRQLALRLRELVRQAQFRAARRQLAAVAKRFERAAGENNSSEHHRGTHAHCSPTGGDGNAVRFAIAEGGSTDFAISGANVVVGANCIVAADCGATTTSPSLLRGSNRLMNRFIAVVSVMLLSGGTSSARTANSMLTARMAPPATKPQNTMTLSDASGRGETNYPLQFGRPFLRGSVPPGKCPVVSAGSVALPTQADVKNRYPDGSAEFAVVAVVVPRIPAHGSVRLSFAPGTCNNTPLSAARMLDASYDFDAVTTVQGQTSGAKHGELIGEINPPARNASALNALTNGGMVVPVGGTNCAISGITGSNIWTRLPAELTACNPTVRLVGNRSQWQVTLSSATATFGYATPPRDGSTDLATMLGLTQASGASLQAPSAGGTSPAPQRASARKMLQAGNYTLWTRGPVAQTIILADDTPSRKYDLGTGDGFHPLRPRFEATFWPATHQVFVRAIGENGLSTELEDTNYGLTITGGRNSRTTEESLASLSQPAMATWTKTFWLGGTPNQQVNIDNNLKYLESTRFFPNYDPSIAISQTTLANDYTTWWTNTNHDIAGSGAWTPGMPTTGQRGDIAPEPSWDTAWLYSGDWRLRQAALGNADLAGWWPVNVRETDPNAVLNRGDAAGSGYGKPISITYRQWVGPSDGGEGEFLYYNSCSYCTTQPNSLKVVGPLNTTTNPWDFDNSHEPAPFFIPYVLSGDPWYLNELEMWAAYDATSNPGGPNPDFNQGRGPTGKEGGAYSQLRGDAWILRNRAEAAFAIPDGDPFKTYLTILTQECIARWEGALGVTDPVLGATTMYQWGQQTGDPMSSFGNGTHTAPNVAPALHNWEAEIIPDGQYNEKLWVSATGITEPWMQWFVQYALGRATELGFAAKPLTLSSGQYLIEMINSTGYPELIASYLLPSWTASGQITSWSQFVANMAQPWLTGNGYTGTAAEGSLPQAFAAALWSNGYDAFASAAVSQLVDNGAPGAARAETWIKANVYRPMIANGRFAGDPIWDIVPRTDRNTLPVQPTTPQ